MDELGFEITDALPWFPHERESPYIFVRVSNEHTDCFGDGLCHAVRRCYLTDYLLQERVRALEQELPGTPESRQAEIINSKLPDAGSTMSGDFGEILVYFYQAAQAHPQIAFGPKKWRFKQDRTKPAPLSDVVQFILPNWPTPSADDVILCAEVKAKATDGASSPIEGAIADCAKDRTSRLLKTLLWLRERAMGEDMGTVQLAHINRFINATDHPPTIKRFHAVAVICSSLVNAELSKAPTESSPDYTLVIISVPNLHDVYTAVFEAVRSSTLAEVHPA